MAHGTPRRERLEELIALVQVYRGWSRRQVAEALGRDPGSMIPDGGNPKLDLFLRLADLLGWSLDTLARDLCAAPSTAPGCADPGAAQRSEFGRLDQLAYDAYLAGRFDDVIRLGEQARRLATCPAQRVRAMLRESGGWEGLGRYANVIDLMNRALSEPEVDPGERQHLRVNLAHAYLMLGRWAEAEGIASRVIDYWGGAGSSGAVADGPYARSAIATAYFTRGHALRLLAESEPADRRALARSAAADLRSAELLYQAQAAAPGSDAHSWVARACRFGAAACDVFAGESSPGDAVETLLGELDAIVEVRRGAHPTRLEYYGWICLYGCSLALRPEFDAGDRDRLLAIFTNKAHEIASHLGNWYLRERVLTMEFLRLQLQDPATPRRVLDREDIELLAGAMDRFPAFRETGWEIIRRVERVED